MPISYLKDFKRWDYYSPLDNKLKIVEASFTPFICYEDGVPCYEANMYMQKLLVDQKSRRIKGGTLKTYAKQIHHLVRYCYNNSTRFSQLNDDRFRHFVQTLQAERSSLGELRRSNNHVIKIAHRTLDFLVFVKNCHGLENFIGEGRENAIRIKYKYYRLPTGAARKTTKITITTHRSIPTRDAEKKRLPVSQDSALAVWKFIQLQDNQEKKARDKLLYQCLEQLGARVSEIHLIKVIDVENAVNSGSNPFLVLTTLKRKDGNEKRNIPISYNLLSSLRQYIKKERRSVIKRTIGKINDHGYLFVSLTTGQPFQSGSTTSYMNIWKKAACVEGEFHPHLFRHAFITNKLREIILQHREITSADKFREHLLYTEKFKLQLQQWTGHTHVHSLDSYIDLVFADIKGYSETYSAVQLKDSVKVMIQQIDSIRDNVGSNSITLTDGLNLFKESLEAFGRDINESLLSIKK